WPVYLTLARALPPSAEPRCVSCAPCYLVSRSVEPHVRPAAGRVLTKHGRGVFLPSTRQPVEARMSTPQRLSRRSVLGLFGVLGGSQLAGARGGSTASV